MDKISTFISTYFDWFYITVPGTVDIIEILILSFFIYRIMSVSYTHLTLPTILLV